MPQSAPAQPWLHSHMPSAQTPCPLQRFRSSQAEMGCSRSLMQARQHSAGATGKIWPAPNRLQSASSAAEGGRSWHKGTAGFGVQG